MFFPIISISSNLIPSIPGDFPFEVNNPTGTPSQSVSRDRGENYVIFGSHIGVGDNSVSNHSKPYDKDNILHCMFSLEKILKMPRSCCVKNRSIYGW